KVPGRFGIWEYFLIGDHRQTQPVAVTLPLIYRVRDTVQFFQSIGTRYYFTQSTSANHPYNTLLYYALARYLDEPSLDADDLIADYCQNMFGPAAKLMTQYYIDQEKAVADSGWHPKLYADVTTPSPLVWTDQLVEQSQLRLKQAKAMVSDALILKRLQRVEAALDGTVKSVNAQKLAGLDRDVKWRLERGEDAYIINADGRDSDAVKQQQMVQNAMDQGNFDPSFAKVLFRSRKRLAPIVKISNDVLEVAVLPEIGGRIIRIKDRQTGWNFLEESPESDTLDQLGAHYFAYGGYEEYVGKAFAGPGWELPYAWEKQTDAGAKRIVLTARVDDYQVTRTISLPNPDKPEIRIQTRLTNLSTTTRKSMLRSHPSFSLGDHPAQFNVRIHAKDGKVIDGQLKDHHDGPQVQPDGKWMVQDPYTKRTLIHTYDTEQASCYLFVNDEKNYFNLELMGREVNLAPNASVVLEQRIYAISNPDERGGLGSDATVSASDQAVAFDVIARKFEPIDGKVKDAAQLDSQSQLLYKTQKVPTSQGTIAMWVKLPVDLAEAENQFLFATGENNPDWFFALLNKGKLSVLFKNGRAPYQKSGEFYDSVHARIAHWPENTWHHVAIAWQHRGTSQSTLKIYLDGKILEQRDNVTLGKQFLHDAFYIGRSSANARFQSDLMIDQLVVSSSMWSDQRVEELYDANLQGKTITWGPSILLDESFD
ncbi:MAG: DUF4838 domain-containing protein, partial [Phycisphaeraceae bacterium JB051]